MEKSLKVVIIDDNTDFLFTMETFRPDTFMEKPVDKQRLLQLIPEVIQKAQKHKRSPKWKKEMEKDWAEKASRK